MSKKSESFQRGVEWVETVLVPAVKRADDEMRGLGAALRLDLNLDRRSTNHPHCDFSFVQTECPSGQSYDGPKYSINVTADCEVRLYKSGAPGRVLGVTNAVGPNQVRELLLRGRQRIRDALSRRVTVRRFPRRAPALSRAEPRDLLAAF